MFANKKHWIILSGAVLLIVYLAGGLYTLQSGQCALILRFGRVTHQVTQSGIHYHLPPPFEKAILVNQTEIQKVPIHHKSKTKGTTLFRNEALLEHITGDENLLIVSAVLSFDVKNPNYYVFNQQDAKLMVESVGQMCLSQELATMTVDDVMTTAKSYLRLALKDKVQQGLDDLHSGIRVISVELTNISPPKQVSNAFKAVSDAREKKQGIIKNAEGYANSIIPTSRGEASSTISQAYAYAEETVNSAVARAETFNALLAEYNRNPEVTAKHKYLESLKKIFSRCQLKIDANPSESIYYIPKQE